MNIVFSDVQMRMMATIAAISITALLILSLNAIVILLVNSPGAFKKLLLHYRNNRLQSASLAMIEDTNIIKNFISENFIDKKLLDSLLKNALNVEVESQTINQISQEIKEVLYKKLKQDLLILIKNINTYNLLPCNLWYISNGLDHLKIINETSIDDIHNLIKKAEVSRPENFLENALKSLMRCYMGQENINFSISNNWTSYKAEKMAFFKDSTEHKKEFQDSIKEIITKYIPSAKDENFNDSLFNHLIPNTFVEDNGNKIPLEKHIIIPSQREIINDIIDQVKSNSKYIFKSVFDRVDAEYLSAPKMINKDEANFAECLENIAKEEFEIKVDEIRIKNTCDAINKIITDPNGQFVKILDKQLERLKDQIKVGNAQAINFIYQKIQCGSSIKNDECKRDSEFRLFELIFNSIFNIWIDKKENKVKILELESKEQEIEPLCLEVDYKDIESLRKQVVDAVKENLIRDEPCSRIDEAILSLIVNKLSTCALDSYVYDYEELNKDQSAKTVDTSITEATIEELNKQQNTIS